MAMESVMLVIQIWTATPMMMRSMSGQRMVEFGQTLMVTDMPTKECIHFPITAHSSMERVRSD